MAMIIITDNDRRKSIFFPEGVAMDVKTIKGISCIFFLFIMLILCSSPYSVAADAATVYERFSRYFDKLPPGPNVVFIDVEKISFVRLDLETRDVAYNV